MCPCTFSRPRPASWPHSPCSAPTVFSSRKSAAAARSCSLGAKGGKRLSLWRRRVMNLSQLRRQAGSATAGRTTMVRGETAIVAGIAHQTTPRLPASSPTPLPSSSHHSSVVRAAPRAPSARAIPVFSPALPALADYMYPLRALSPSPSRVPCARTGPRRYVPFPPTPLALRTHLPLLSPPSPSFSSTCPPRRRPSFTLQSTSNTCCQKTTNSSGPGAA